jgi:hypothetical protein
VHTQRRSGHSVAYSEQTPRAVWPVQECAANSAVTQPVLLFLSADYERSANEADARLTQLYRAPNPDPAEGLRRLWSGSAKATRVRIMLRVGITQRRRFHLSASKISRVRLLPCVLSSSPRAKSFGSFKQRDVGAHQSDLIDNQGRQVQRCRMLAMRPYTRKILLQHSDGDRFSGNDRQ